MNINNPNVRNVIYQALMLIGAVLAAFGFVSMDQFTELANQIMQILPAVLLVGQSLLAKRYLTGYKGEHRVGE